ncbi:LIM domain only protein 3 isoform X1 [Lethenteron reissneri]|uniref:LIM domain only protein 3 isoform X1 n=1 Tax=Lethenteron reissneri TaxID=7753 RepID=UPI002AB64731|nr:LIM domain only protein 3 isoform X1 [Lethenteron reissneri]
MLWSCIRIGHTEWGAALCHHISSACTVKRVAGALGSSSRRERGFVTTATLLPLALSPAPASQAVQMLSVQSDGKPKGCAGCNRKIKDRYLLKALDKYWHEDCLKCACCDCRLGEVGSTLYTRANLILCRRDYLRLFGVTGNCAACSKLIPAFEMVMRARDNVYHLDCFACQLCNHRFCVGDKFFLKNNMILCQMDYEEGAMKENYQSQVR